MKKLFLAPVLGALLLSLLATPSGAASYYCGNADCSKQDLFRPIGDPIVLPSGHYALKILDVYLGASDTVYSRPIDLINVPIIYRDTGTGDAALVYDYGLGNIMLSCYDYSDSAAVTDSVDVTGQIYQSYYARDNVNPLSFKSDAWATLGSALSIDDASASSAILEATAAVTPTSELARYLRLRLINDHAVVKDKPRCTAFLVKKEILR